MGYACMKPCSAARLITFSCISEILIPHLSDSVDIPIACCPSSGTTSHKDCVLYFTFGRQSYCGRRTEKCLRYALYLSLDKEQTRNESLKACGLWFRESYFQTSLRKKNVHHYEKVTKLITILRNEHSSSLLKTMQDLAIKTLKKWSHPGRKKKLPSPQCS